MCIGKENRSAASLERIRLLDQQTIVKEARASPFGAPSIAASSASGDRRGPSHSELRFQPMARIAASGGPMNMTFAAARRRRNRRSRRNP